MVSESPGDRIVALVIEDDSEDLASIRTAFARATWLRVHLEVSTRLQSALTRLAEQDVDVVLLDLSLPDSRGVDTYAKLHEAFPDVPVIVLSSPGQEASAVAAMRLGAQDHLFTARLDEDALSRSIRYVVERQRMQREIRGLATVDGLTGLYNLRGFVPLAEHHLKLGARTDTPVTLLFLDLDGLAGINDTFGRAEGSQTLVDTARVLQRAVRDSDVVARIGGDEFCVLLTGESSGAASGVLTRIVEAIASHKARSGRPYNLSLSVGAATFDPRQPCGLEELMALAGDRMREQKRSKREPT